MVFLLGVPRGYFFPGKLEERVMEGFCVFGCMRTLDYRVACAMIKKEERALPIDGLLPSCVTRSNRRVVSWGGYFFLF